MHTLLVGSEKGELIGIFIMIRSNDFQSICGSFPTACHTLETLDRVSFHQLEPTINSWGPQRSAITICSLNGWNCTGDVLDGAHLDGETVPNIALQGDDLSIAALREKHAGMPLIEHG